MNKRFLLASLLALGLYAQDSEALTPVTAATLAEKINRQDQAGTDGFVFQAEKVERPYGGPADQINGQLWKNPDTNEAVIVLHTQNAVGISGLTAVAAKFFPADKLAGYVREQGQLYNEFVRAQHPELSGGLAQKAAAIVAENAISGIWNLGRGVGYLYDASKKAVQARMTGGAAQGPLLPIAQPQQRPQLGYTPEWDAEQAKQRVLKAQKIDQKIRDAVGALYLNLTAELDKDDTVFVIGHGLAGYHAQYLAYMHNLKGFSFGAMGLGLNDTESAKANNDFFNISRTSDKFGDLYTQHYGLVRNIPDLPITVVKGLEKSKHELKLRDSYEDRYRIMGEYLTQNHAIDGYARQLAEQSPQASPKPRRSPEVSDRDAASSVAATTTTTTAKPPVAPPPAPKPPIMPVVESDDNDNDRVAAPAAPKPPKAPKQPVEKPTAAGAASAGNGCAGLLSAIEGGFKLRETAGPKIRETAGGVVDDSNFTPLEREYRQMITKEQYQASDKKWPVTMSKQMWYNLWKKDAYAGFDIDDAAKTDDDRAARVQIINTLPKTFGLKK